MLVITTVCILRYAERVREDKTKSIVYGIPNIADVGSVEDRCV